MESQTTAATQHQIAMLKIAVIGPESTGKTELARGLAEHYGGEWIPEYARSYVERIDRPYCYDDLCRIAEQQIETEKRILQNSSEEGLIFFDTELIITKVWFEYVYGRVPEAVIRQLESGFFDYYLLCTPDLPWQPDPVREHPEKRDYFFERYRREIEALQKPYAVVSGQGAERLQAAIAVVDNIKLKDAENPVKREEQNEKLQTLGNHTASRTNR